MLSSIFNHNSQNHLRTDEDLLADYIIAISNEGHQLTNLINSLTQPIKRWVSYTLESKRGLVKLNTDPLMLLLSSVNAYDFFNKASLETVHSISDIVSSTNCRSYFDSEEHYRTFLMYLEYHCLKKPGKLEAWRDYYQLSPASAIIDWFNFSNISIFRLFSHDNKSAAQEICQTFKAHHKNRALQIYQNADPEFELMDSQGYVPDYLLRPTFTDQMYKNLGCERLKTIFLEFISEKVSAILGQDHSLNSTNPAGTTAMQLLVILSCEGYQLPYLEEYNPHDDLAIAKQTLEQALQAPTVAHPTPSAPPIAVVVTSALYSK